jgi:hypothetical protein
LWLIFSTAVENLGVSRVGEESSIVPGVEDCRRAHRFALAVIACACFAGCTGVVASRATDPPQNQAGDGGSAPDADEAESASPPPAPCRDTVAAPPLQASYASHQVTSIAVGPDAIYWAEGCGDCLGTDGTLWREPLAGGPPAPMPFPVRATGRASTPTSLATDGSSLWFVDGDGLLRIGLDGSNPQQVVARSSLPVGSPLAGTAFDSDNLYAVGPASDGSSDTVVVSIPRLGGAPTLLARVAHRDGPALGSGLVVDATRVYWYDYEESSPSRGGVFAASKSGAGSAALLVTLVASGGAQDTVALASGSGDSVFAVGTADRTLRRLHTGQPTVLPETVATSAAAPIAVSGDDVYFISALAAPASVQHVCGDGPGATPSTEVSTLDPGALALGFAAAPGQLFVAGGMAPDDPQAPAEGVVWELAR